MSSPHVTVSIRDIIRKMATFKWIILRLFSCLLPLYSRLSFYTPSFLWDRVLFLFRVLSASKFTCICKHLLTVPQISPLWLFVQTRITEVCMPRRMRDILPWYVASFGLRQCLSEECTNTAQNAAYLGSCFLISTNSMLSFIFYKHQATEHLQITIKQAFYKFFENVKRSSESFQSMVDSGGALKVRRVFSLT